jgi:ribosomal protein S18 acetylase RimI-like enzyme
VESTYFKRFRMEADLGPPGPEPQLPPGYRFVPWNEAILDVHARTKYRAFRDEVDAQVFPCLASLEGCRRLMHEIRRKAGFLPDATWLIARGSSPADLQWCGTIQVVNDRGRNGMIQNIGIVPGHRGQGLGSCLIQQAFAGLRCRGFRTASLEVTAENCGAVRLYKRLGFRRTKTLYKVCDGQVSESRMADVGTPCIGVVAGRTEAALT